VQGRGRALVPGTMERLIEAFVKAGNMSEVKAALNLMKDSGHMPSQVSGQPIICSRLLYPG